MTGPGAGKCIHQYDFYCCGWNKISTNRGTGESENIFVWNRNEDTVSIRCILCCILFRPHLSKHLAIDGSIIGNATQTQALRAFNKNETTWGVYGCLFCIRFVNSYWSCTGQNQKNTIRYDNNNNNNNNNTFTIITAPDADYGAAGTESVATT